MCDLSPLSLEMGTQIAVSRADSLDKGGHCLRCPVGTFLRLGDIVPARSRGASQGGGASHRPHTKGLSSEGAPHTSSVSNEERARRQRGHKSGKEKFLCLPQMKPMWSAARQSPDHCGRPHSSGSATRPRNGTGHKATPQPIPGGMQTGVEMARLHLGGGNHNLGLGPFTPQPACALPSTHTPSGAGSQRAELAR